MATPSSKDPLAETVQPQSLEQPALQGAQISRVKWYLTTDDGPKYLSAEDGCLADHAPLAVGAGIGREHLRSALRS